jgi:hypothetical protein
MTHKALLILKAELALVLAAVLLVMFLPRLMDLFGRTTVDQGARPLVAITTSGGDRGYTLSVRSFVTADGDYRFVVFFVSSGVTFGDSGNTFPIDTLVTLASSDDGATMRCTSGSGLTPAVEVEELAPGVRSVIEVDAVSGRNSSTQFESEVDRSTPSAATSTAPTAQPDAMDPASIVDSLTMRQYSARLWLLDDTYDYSSAFSQDGYVYAVECQLERELVWRSVDPADPTNGAEATLLVPEFDFSATAAGSDFQQDLDAQLRIERGEGVELLRSYPEFSIGSAGWQHDYSTLTRGSLGEEGYFLYTEKPTALFQNREVIRQEQNFIFIGGIALGLLVTLIVGSVSDLLGAIVPHRGDLTEEQILEAQRMRRSRRSLPYVAHVLGVSTSSLSAALAEAERRKKGKREKRDAN